MSVQVRYHESCVKRIFSILFSLRDNSRVTRRGHAFLAGVFIVLTKKSHYVINEHHKPQTAGCQTSHIKFHHRTTKRLAFVFKIVVLQERALKLDLKKFIIGIGVRMGYEFSHFIISWTELIIVVNEKCGLVTQSLGTS